MAINVPSGIVTATSGAGATIAYANAQPVSVFGASGATAIGWTSGGDGKQAFNVFVVSGSVVGGGGAGSIAGLQSGTMVIVSGGPVGLSGLNVIASVTTTLAGYQSGTLVGISGGQLALSGLNVIISGQDVTITALNNLRVSGSPLLLTGASGGVALPSLTSKSVLLTNHSGNSSLFIGSTTDVPYSGFGYMLEGTASISIDVANPSTIKWVHTTSGSLVSYMVVMS